MLILLMQKQKQEQVWGKECHLELKGSQRFSFSFVPNRRKEHATLGVCYLGVCCCLIKLWRTKKQKTKIYTLFWGNGFWLFARKQINKQANKETNKFFLKFQTDCSSQKQRENGFEEKRVADFSHIPALLHTQQRERVCVYVF